MSHLVCQVIHEEQIDKYGRTVLPWCSLYFCYNSHECTLPKMKLFLHHGNIKSRFVLSCFLKPEKAASVSGMYCYSLKSMMINLLYLHVSSDVPVPALCHVPVHLYLAQAMTAGPLQSLQLLQT